MTRKNASNKKTDLVTSKKTLLPTLRNPELFFGLCSPMGTDNTKVIQLLTKLLNNLGYRSIPTKVTRLMKQISIVGLSTVDSPIEERYESHITYANKLRDVYERNDVLASICCLAVSKHRRKDEITRGLYSESTAYIFDQFKRPEEITTLRRVYGRLFVCVSVYSERERRIKFLSDAIARGHNVPRATNDHEAAAKRLITKDEDEESIPNGQRLRDALMPKRKEPELDPKEQFKRFQETAKELGVDDRDAERAFSTVSNGAESYKSKKRLKLR